MTSQGASRMCGLKRFEFPNYWEPIVESLGSAEQVVARIKELYAAYEPKEGEGTSFALQDDQGNTLHVGCSDEGWVIMYDPKGGAGRIAVGDSTATGHKPFLFPEWTDFERRHLLAPSNAEAVVKEWVQTGRLSNQVTWVD